MPRPGVGSRIGRLTVVACLLVLAGCFKGSGSASPSSTHPGAATGSAPRATPGVGSTLTLDGWMDGERMKVALLQVVDPANPSGYLPMDGHRFVAIRLGLANVGSTDYNACPDLQATVVDAAGAKETPDITEPMQPSFACDRNLVIKPGRQEDGFVTFEVPVGTGLRLLQYSLADFGRGQVGSWGLAG